jgi:hypothetical protein
MATKDYIWDAEAAHKIEEQTLDKHYRKNKEHYDGLASDAWKGLQAISAHAQDLKAADLTALLRPIIDRDSVTLKGMEDLKLPEPNGRLGPQWYSWFTQYVVEQYLSGNKGSG